VERGDSALGLDLLAERIQAYLLLADHERLRPVINATGIVLHTGLGRAVLPGTAAHALSCLDRCCNLQIDLDTGQRGKRNFMTERLLCRLTGAEAALVVNNNAAATLLILSSLCKGMDVVISRGQLIEIGGSYRLPDCIQQSGALMVEVGTTNKTHLRDYERVISENTAALLRVNPSNYRIVGFSHQVSTRELATLKEKYPVLIIDDLGCGAMVDLSQYGLPKEPTAMDSLAEGADLVCFSGDKLLGGPQAGIIVGRSDLIGRMRKHPLTRMLRVGKLTDMALEQTLRLFLEPERLVERHPTLKMLTLSAKEVKRRASRLKRRLDKENVALEIRVLYEQSAVGGGAMPDSPLPTFVLAIHSRTSSPDELARRLRYADPPVITRIKDNEVFLDLRTVLEDEEDALGQVLLELCSE